MATSYHARVLIIRQLGKLQIWSFQTKREGKLLYTDTGPVKLYCPVFSFLDCFWTLSLRRCLFFSISQPITLFFLSACCPFQAIALMRIKNHTKVER